MAGIRALGVKIRSMNRENKFMGVKISMCAENKVIGVKICMDIKKIVHQYGTKYLIKKSMDLTNKFMGKK